MTPAKEIDGEMWIKADDHHWAVGEIEAEWQRRCDDVKQEANYWHKRHDAVMDSVMKTTFFLANPPIKMMAHAESYEVGCVKGKADAAEELREEHAQIVEAMGMQGYGTLAIAAAIRKELMK